jgi:hypothetical protein
MKYALFNGEKTEATKGAKGTCPSCSSELIAKCGEKNVNHWAHKGNRNCDPWWENETDWHRSWKNNFPKEWQEVIHSNDESGEKHIADVKTEGGWVLEFQHSHLKTDERESRDSFYPKLVWILDGTRRKRDKPKFQELLDVYRIRSVDSRFINILGPDHCALLKEWQDSNAYVFLDFQDLNDEMQPILWFVFPRIAGNEAYLWPISREIFIILHNNNKFDELVNKEIIPFINKLIDDEKSKKEMEEFRRRQRASMINWPFAIRRGRF